MHNEPQEFPFLGRYRAALSAPDAQNEVRGWSLLAIASLAIAGVFALLVAMSRVPGVEDIFPWPLQFFQKGLVIHVVYSIVLWFLTVLGALSAAAAHGLGTGAKTALLGKTALGLAALTTVLLFIPALMDDPEPSLNNYVPVIIHPLYYGALALLALAIVLAVARLLWAISLTASPLPVEVDAIRTAGLIALAALMCFGIAAVFVWGEEPTAALNEDLFWGGGHALQFVNVTLMVLGWALLAGLGRGDGPAAAPWLKGAVALLFLGVLPAPMLYFIFEPFSADQRDTFTLMQFLLAPAPLIMALGLILAAVRAKTDGTLPLISRLPRQALIISAAVFFLGGFLGLFVDGADTRTPAHYHGVIGGVNVAFFGLFICFLLPVLGRAARPGRALTSLFWLYGVGQALHSLGLFLAGGYGAPRKTAGNIEGLDALGAQIGLYMLGVGALIAIIGGVMFAYIVGKALLKKPAGISVDVRV